MFFLPDSSFPVLVIDDPSDVGSLYLARTQEKFVKTILYIAFDVHKIHEKDQGFINIDAEEIDLLNTEDASNFPLFYEKRIFCIAQKLQASLLMDNDIDKVFYLFGHDDIDGACDQFALRISSLMRNTWVRDIVDKKNLHKIIELYCVQMFMSYHPIEIESIFEV